MEFFCECCGEKYARDTYNSHSSKSSKEYWREKRGSTYGLCSKCYRQDQEKKQEATLRATKLFDPEEVLQPLIGTEKQVAWAEKIRTTILSEYLPSVERNIARYEQMMNDPRNSDNLIGLEILGRMVDRLKADAGKYATETGASTWIDRRHDTASEEATQMLNKNIEKMNAEIRAVTGKKES